MRLIRDLTQLSRLKKGCALAIGNFDGLHCGHRAIIKRLKAQAKRLALPSALMVFEPMPLEFLAPVHAPARLSSLREKFEDAQNLNIDYLVCARFNQAFADLSAQQFMQDLLLERLYVGYVLVGEDFRFAHNRQGNVARLKSFGKQHGFKVDALAPVKQGAQRVSSTQIRQALSIGELAKANQLLGHAYRISGRVATGQKLGRQLGFPTANIRMHRRVALCYGVYATRVRLEDSGAEYYGAASIGVRPAVGGHDCLLEVYLLDYTGDLYRKRISVMFDAFIRPEADFENLEALTAKITEDVGKIRQFYQDNIKTYELK